MFLYISVAAVAVLWTILKWQGEVTLVKPVFIFFAKSCPTWPELRGISICRETPWTPAAAERSRICSPSRRSTLKQQGAISRGSSGQGGCCTAGVLHFNHASLVTGTAEGDGNETDPCCLTLHDKHCLVALKTFYLLRIFPVMLMWNS